MKKTIFAKLHNFNNDLHKRWFISYGLYDEKLKRMVRRKVYLPSNPKDLEYRSKLSQELIFEINKKLNEGLLFERKKDKKIDTTNFMQVVEAMLDKLVDKELIVMKTRQTYLSACKHFNSYLLLNSMHYTEFKKTNLNSFLDSLTVTNNHKKVVRSHLRSVFSILVQNEILAFNPFLGSLKLKTIESDFNHPFSDYEKDKLEVYMQEYEPNLYLLTRFIFYAFIRPKELLNLRVRDIDLRNRTIKIKSSIAKNDKSESVPIIKPLMDLILKSGVLSNPSDYYLFGQGLIPSRTKSPMNEPTTMHREVLQKLGFYVERVTVLYSWKHTGNIFAYMAGIDIKLIQRINRHSSLATTEIYLKKLGLFLDKNAFDSSW